MKDDESVASQVTELLELDESQFLSYFHHNMEKARHKAWHERHVKTKYFAQGDQVLLYDSKYQKHPQKLQMHWLGPFIVVEIQDSGVVKLAKINVILHPGWVNDACLKSYLSNQ
jgi:hypothetical protein